MKKNESFKLISGGRMETELKEKMMKAIKKIKETFGFEPTQSEFIRSAIIQWSNRILASDLEELNIK